MNDITHVIEGMGEVGSTLFELLKKDEKLNLLGNDINHAKIKSRSKIETHLLLKEGCDVLHICFPYSVNFEKDVLFLAEKYQAKETVIHSTVPPGTTQKIQKAVWKRGYARTEKTRLDQLIVYSPVRGVHSRMLLDFKRYTKFWSCVQSPNTTKREPVLYLSQLNKYGIKTKMMSNPTVLELAKIYVDSVASYSPLILKDISGNLTITSIEDFWMFLQSPSIIVNNGEMKLIDGWSVFTKTRNRLGGHSYWTPIQNIFRHFYKGNLIRVNTFGGMLDVSPNHALVEWGAPGRLLNAVSLSKQDRLSMPLIEYAVEGDKGKWFAGTQELAWLYGFFAAEGSCPNMKGYPYFIQFSNKREDLLQKSEEIFEANYNIQSCIVKSGTILQLTANNKSVHNMLRKKFYTNQGMKKVPSEILNAPLTIREAFLDGYFVGDGHDDPKYHFPHQRCDTNSQPLAAGIQWLMHVNHPTRGCAIFSRLDKINITCLRFNKGQGQHLSQELRTAFSIPYEGYLYDLETCDHTFTAGVGAIRTHNTSYYGWLILYAQHTKEVSDQYHVDWNEMWQFSDEIESFLNNRPKMFPGEGIGGHCVLQNLELIADEFLDMVFAHDKHYRRNIVIE